MHLKYSGHFFSLSFFRLIFLFFVSKAENTLCNILCNIHIKVTIKRFYEVVNNKKGANESIYYKETLINNEIPKIRNDLANASSIFYYAKKILVR